MSGIFISYRRSDSAYIAGRLRDDLAERFGDDLVVFRDVETLPLGRFPDGSLRFRRARACGRPLVASGEPAFADPDVEAAIAVIEGYEVEARRLQRACNQSGPRLQDGCRVTSLRSSAGPTEDPATTHERRMTTWHAATSSGR